MLPLFIAKLELYPPAPATWARASAAMPRKQEVRTRQVSILSIKNIFLSLVGFRPSNIFALNQEEGQVGVQAQALGQKSVIIFMNGDCELRFEIKYFLLIRLIQANKSASNPVFC